MASFGKKYNALRREEEFLIADAMRSLNGRQFPDWKSTIEYFSEVAKRPLTQLNIEGICKDLRLDINTIVEQQKKRQNKVLLKIKELEKRLDDHERQISRLI